MRADQASKSSSVIVSWEEELKDLVAKEAKYFPWEQTSHYQELNG